MSDMLNFQSDVHRRYILKLQEICFEVGLSLVVKGSVAKGTATPYSDVDVLIIGDVTDSLIDEFISCNGIPVMSNYTENPKGILILVYEDGLSVDLEFRYSLSEDELEESVVLVESPKGFIVAKDYQRRDVKSRYLPTREKWYKDFRLGHRALIKYLAKKEDAAYELLDEIKEKFSYFDLHYSGDFKSDIRLLIGEVFRRYSVDKSYKAVLEKLMKFL